MYFPTKYLCTYPQDHHKPPFWGTFQLMRNLLYSQSHINGATTLKASTWMCFKIFLLGDIWGAGPLNVNLGPPIILKTTGVRKMKLKTQLHVVKYSLRVKKNFPLSGVQWVQGPLM